MRLHSRNLRRIRSMATPDSVELAAEVVAAFISNNPLPRGELPALIQAVHSAVERLGKGPESAPPQVEMKSASGAHSQVRHARLFDLSGGRQAIQIVAASPGGVRPDAGAVSRKMEAAVRLSYGRAQLRGAAIGYGETDRTWPDSAESRCSQEAWPVRRQDLIVAFRHAIDSASRRFDASAVAPSRSSV